MQLTKKNKALRHGLADIFTHMGINQDGSKTSDHIFSMLADNFLRDDQNQKPDYMGWDEYIKRGLMDCLQDIVVGLETDIKMLIQKQNKIYKHNGEGMVYIYMDKSLHDNTVSAFMLMDSQNNQTELTWLSKNVEHVNDIAQKYQNITFVYDPFTLYNYDFGQYRSISMKDFGDEINGEMCYYGEPDLTRIVTSICRKDINIKPCD